jgi:hypothetical protein
VDYLLADGQAQASSRGFGREKRLKDLRGFFSEPFPFILNNQENPVGSFFLPNLDRSPCGHGLDDILNQVYQDSSEKLVVGMKWFRFPASFVMKHDMLPGQLFLE